jgi:hypothetical protein
MFTEETWIRLEEAARVAYVDLGIPMKAGSMGLARRRGVYQIENPERGCCITATLVLGHTAGSEDIDNAYVIANERLNLTTAEGNALWMAWDFIQHPGDETTHVVRSGAKNDAEIITRITEIRDRLLLQGARYSTHPDDD